MANRFGRNQRRKMREKMERLEHTLRSCEDELERSRSAGREGLARALRDQLTKGVIPLEVEHFIAPDQRNLIVHAIFDDRRSNLHYQHAVSPQEITLQRDRDEREQFGQYLGRAIADRLADAYAGKTTGSSRRAA